VTTDCYSGVRLNEPFLAERLAMVVIWGTTHAGKVDQVPGGMFHVVTRFGHVYYVPLFPTASFLVLEETGDGGFQGAQIPFSFKSALAGWLRGFSVVGLIVSGIWLAIALADKKLGPFAWVRPCSLASSQRLCSCSLTNSSSSPKPAMSGPRNWLSTLV
jgi:hypothetical protein